MRNDNNGNPLDVRQVQEIFRGTLNLTPDQLVEMMGDPDVVSAVRRLGEGLEDINTKSDIDTKLSYTPGEEDKVEDLTRSPDPSVENTSVSRLSQYNLLEKNTGSGR